MKQGPLGIYYLEYSINPFPRSARKLIIGFTKQDMIHKITEREIPENWYFILTECRTIGTLVEGNLSLVLNWIGQHMPLNFKDPIR